MDLHKKISEMSRISLISKKSLIGLWIWNEYQE